MENVYSSFMFVFRYHRVICVRRGVRVEGGLKGTWELRIQGWESSMGKEPRVKVRKRSDKGERFQDVSEPFCYLYWLVLKLGIIIQEMVF